MSLFPLERSQDFHAIDKVTYTSSNVTTVDTPIFVSGFGALVPVVSQSALTANTFFRYGRFRATVTNGVTISQLDPVYYITATGFVTNADPSSAGFLLGMATEILTATVVVVEINGYFAAPAFGNQNISTSGNLAAAASTLSSAVVNTGLTVKAAQVAEYTVVANGTDANVTLSAANIFGGLITGTITTADKTYTMPTAASVWALLSSPVAGSTIKFTVKNLTASTYNIIIAASASITNGGVAGDLTIAASATATFKMVFTSSTAAVIYKI